MGQIYIVPHAKQRLLCENFIAYNDGLLVLWFKIFAELNGGCVCYRMLQ